MRNRLFSILIALFVPLTFMSCILAQNSPRQNLTKDGIAHLGKGAITDIKYSPDGTRLAVANTKGIWLYDARTGNKLVQFTGFTDSAATIAFSPDGNILAGGGVKDNTIRLWDANTGKNLRKFTGPTNWTRSVAFSPDGKTLINGSWDKTLYLLDVDTGKTLRTFTGHTEKIWNVAFSPDGKTIASGGRDKTVRLWDARTGELLQTLTGHRATVWDVAFSPDGKTIVSTSVYHAIYLWDANIGQLLRTLTRENTRIIKNKRDLVRRMGRMVTFSPDGKTIASDNILGGVDLWDVKTGRHLRTLIKGFSP